MGKNISLGETGRNNVDKVARYWRDHVVDQPGTFLRVPKNSILVDEAYQRHPNEEKVKAIAGKWSWASFGAITLFRRSDGSLYVVDGQHRLLAALKRSDVQLLPCIVFESLGPEVEAGAFLGANTLRKPVTAMEKFNARIVTKDELATEIALLAESIGRTITNNTSPNSIHCVAAVGKCLTIYPEETRRVFHLAGEVMHGHPFREGTLRGLVYLERACGTSESLTKPRWRNRLIQVGVVAIEQSISEAAAFYNQRGGRVCAIGVYRAINRGLRNPLKPEKPLTDDQDAD